MFIIPYDVDILKILQINVAKNTLSSGIFVQMMHPITYDEPVFRPPAEAYSAILQVTTGCSWNCCVFCEMYKMKKFRIRPIEEITKEIKQLASYYPGFRKLFLADGNAMVLSPNKLISIIQSIRLYFPRIQRISAYALPKDIADKTDEELVLLREHGLKLLYIGIETGNNDLLALIKKGETYDSMVRAMEKAHRAGIQVSVMIITGLGGKHYTREHAIDSANIINAIQPRFLSLLTLALPYGTETYNKALCNKFIPLTMKELLDEILLFVSSLDLKSTIFRSDHMSNLLSLKGNFPRDKENLLKQIYDMIKNMAEDHPYRATAL